MELVLRYFYNVMNYKTTDSVTMVIHKKKGEDEYFRYTNTIKFSGKEMNRGDSFSASKGIVKFAFQETNGESADTFETAEEKEKKLINKYSYTEKEAKKMLEDKKKSYYSKTIVHKGSVWGVIYMTSTTYEKFCKNDGKIPQNFSKRVSELTEFIQNEIIEN